MIKLVEQQSPLAPLHALPHEYPLLAIIPFTLTLLVPYQWFLLEFAVWMTLVAGIIYFILSTFFSIGWVFAFPISAVALGLLVSGIAGGACVGAVCGGRSGQA